MIIFKRNCATAVQIHLLQGRSSEGKTLRHGDLPPIRFKKNPQYLTKRDWRNVIRIN